MNIRINSNIFKKTINQWEFITLFVKKVRVESDFVNIIINSNCIKIFFDKEAHSLDLNDISEIVGYDNVIIGRDDYSNHMICCL